MHGNILEKDERACPWPLTEANAAVTECALLCPCSPQNMLEELRVRPTLKVLEDLGICLAYRSTAWLAMYCRLGGVAMQLEVQPWQPSLDI